MRLPSEIDKVARTIICFRSQRDCDATRMQRKAPYTEPAKAEFVESKKENGHDQLMPSLPFHFRGLPCFSSIAPVKRAKLEGKSKPQKRAELGGRATRRKPSRSCKSAAVFCCWLPPFAPSSSFQHNLARPC